MMRGRRCLWWALYLWSLSLSQLSTFSSHFVFPPLLLLVIDHLSSSFGLFGALIILKTCGSGEQKKKKKTVTTSHPHFLDVVPVRSVFFSRTHTYTHTLDTRWCILPLLLFSRWRIPRRQKRLRSRRRGESKQPLKSGRKTQRRHLRRRGVIQRRRAPERVPLKWVAAVWKEHPIFD